MISSRDAPRHRPSHSEVSTSLDLFLNRFPLLSAETPEEPSADIEHLRGSSVPQIRLTYHLQRGSPEGS